MIDPVAASLGRVLAFALAPAGPRGRLSILLYHRVWATRDPAHDWDVTAEEFEGQMRMLARDWSPLPLDEAIERLQRRSLPRRAVCVTFDDGYADNADVALPILQRLGVPATFFIATAYLDGGRMWNDKVVDAVRSLPQAEVAVDLDSPGPVHLPRGTPALQRRTIERILQAWKYLPGEEREARANGLAALAGLGERDGPMMRPEQVRALRAAGMGVGAHTVTHPILALADANRARAEIGESRDRLATLLGEPVRLFAYPNGKPGRDYRAEHVRMVRECGYQAAVSTAAGVAVADTDPYQLPRFTPWDRSPGRFALRLAGNLRRALPG